MITLDCYNKGTLKDLRMLLALTSATRASEICLNDTKYLVEYSSGYVFHFGKNYRHGKSKELLLSFTQKRKLISTHIVSFWILEVLNLARIDAEMLSGYSTRSA